MHTNTKFKRRYDYGSDTDDWLITYTDTITLLLAFFVLILSTADIDQSKFEEKLQGIAETLLKREKAKLPLSEVKKKLDEVFKKYELEDEVEVMLDRKGITVEFASQSFYPSGSANILPTAVPVLEGIGEALSGISLSAYMIEVEGHTDDVPIQTPLYPSNWELSVNRATNIVKFLQTIGIDQEHLKAAGYGETRPKVPNVAEDGTPIPENRAENRRVVVFVHRE